MKLSLRQKAEIIAAYRAGEKSGSIALRYGISRNYISILANKARRPKPVKPPEIAEPIVHRPVALLHPASLGSGRSFHAGYLRLM